MKKTVLFFILFIIPAVMFAQYNSAAIKLGYYSPDATDGGFILGYEGGKNIDEHLNIGWSIDWFNKNYTDKKLVDEFNQFNNLNVEVNELRAKTNLHDIPVLFNVNAHFPAAPKVNVYGSLSFGAEVLLVFYRNYENPDDDELKGAIDFSWRFGFGGTYELGSRSELLAELAYHSSKPSWEYEVTDPVTGNTKTFERVYDMNGILLRVGVKYYF